MSWAVSARWPLVRFHPKTSRFWDDFCFPNVCNTCPCLKNSPFSTGPTFHGFSCRFSHFQTSQPPTFEPQKKSAWKVPHLPVPGASLHAGRQRRTGTASRFGGVVPRRHGAHAKVGSSMMVNSQADIYIYIYTYIYILIYNYIYIYIYI